MRRLLASPALQPLAAYWQARTPRERRTLAIGGALLVLMLGYALVWNPARQGSARLAAGVPKLRADLMLVQRQGAEVQSLRQAAPKARLDAAGAIAALRAAAEARGIGRSLDRVEAMGSDRVRAVFNAVAFDAWIAWAEQIHRDHQLIVDVVRVDAIERPGFTKVEVVLAVPNAR